MATGNMMCNEGFQADGEVRLHSAGIGSQLSFRSAHLDGKGGPALTANWLTVTGNMYCDEGFQADGTVDLSSASIGRPAHPQRRAPGRKGRACPGRPGSHRHKGHVL